MFGSSPRGFLVLLPILLPSVLAQFNLKDNFVGNEFFSGFKWETMDDPTHGRVNYVDQQTAKSKNLSYVNGNTFVMRADSTTKLTASTPRGRDSIRITSQNTYTDSVIVLDVAHMPEGCATWPAFWTVTAGKWPYGGEIDILEGVNTGTQNLATLHTGPGCTMPGNRKQTGKPANLNCDVTQGSNQGCGNTFSKPNSYGSALNSVKGGWFVLKRTNKDGAAVWFWPRNDPKVPNEIKSGAKSVNPGDSWGEPEALFPTDTCNWQQHFDAHNIVFDLTFCGDWAGSDFSCGGGAQCPDYVNNNPDKFKDAYWEVNAVRVYTP
ncbi:2 beta-glucans in both donor and acceptor sites of Gh16 Laminarinase 16a [Fomitiporia mediterranea MF3/22]|uniref:2 beta-glucans in both donor and acceptor sites of Gh16 Laminarinase 16a n=1 Tax=Fomitiporia mediterranea (strain MF3/22) TaxID=694068 RepID=UPI0004409464|nr:2 beta-glucans in both donor and acceptor sites of Gh16 Laminarinase 16a [Fomitiporia mediterranea MF3/22]EJD03022.1 2 beta-glucans in both donor and acceptor sites of Gh16 Laminarinase 16a [Fomitiporia mediterranea MF3/22]